MRAQTLHMIWYGPLSSLMSHVGRRSCRLSCLFFFKQKTASEIWYGLVGWEMCKRDRPPPPPAPAPVQASAAPAPVHATPAAAAQAAPPVEVSMQSASRYACRTLVTLLGPGAVSYPHLTLPTSDIV